MLQLLKFSLLIWVLALVALMSIPMAPFPERLERARVYGAKFVTLDPDVLQVPSLARQIMTTLGLAKPPATPELTARDRVPVRRAGSTDQWRRSTAPYSEITTGPASAMDGVCADFSAPNPVSGPALAPCHYSGVIVRNEDPAPSPELPSQIKMPGQAGPSAYAP